MAVNNPLFMVKAVLVGDSGVGKSYILSQVCTNEFSYQFKSSTWIETNNYHIKEDDGSTIITQIWEIPSHERSQKQQNSYYRGTDIAVIVYDIMRKATFRNVEKWVKEVRDYTDQNITIMLVGTKADRSHLRAVKIEEAKAYAEKENLLFMETSATDSLNLQNALKSLIIPIYHKRKATTMRQTVNHGGEDPGIVSIEGTTDQIANQDLIMATGSFSEDDNPIIEIEPPILSSENFSIWKNRMIGFLNLIDDKLLETIKEGRHTPVKEQNKWSDEDKQKVALDNKAMHILSMSLPDDIYRCVIYCESAKEMWDNIIVLFEGSEDTRECRRSLLIEEYNFFACKPGESLTNTYIRFKCIVNELRQYNKTFGNEEMLTKFIRSLPTEWSAMLNMLRETHALKTMSLEVLYGGLLTFEREKKHDSWLKERVALQDAFSSQRGQLAGNNIR